MQVLGLYYQGKLLLQDVCAALIDEIPRYVKNDSVIGVFYGHTLTALARQLPKIKRKGVSVIQLAGGFSRAVYESNSLSILRSFADCFGGTAYQIPAPAMVGSGPRCRSSPACSSSWARWPRPASSACWRTG